MNTFFTIIIGIFIIFIIICVADYIGRDFGGAVGDGLVPNSEEEDINKFKKKLKKNNEKKFNSCIWKS
jgi:hypothetical protein